MGSIRLFPIKRRSQLPPFSRCIVIIASILSILALIRHLDGIEKNNTPSGVRGLHPFSLVSTESLKDFYIRLDVNYALNEAEEPDVKIHFEKAVERAHKYAIRKIELNPPKRKSFELAKWNKNTTGGLNDKDRLLLADAYSKADSVFEYGLGESTMIADHVGVPLYAGVDSDPNWVAKVRNDANPHYHFYLAEVGETGRWGWPVKYIPKGVLAYQLAPLMSETKPFDVYFVDGRW
eukprot:CAMPEP_0198154894 /NCGR_PEP_ID=MMETSP1443-20131203/68839_1 /TAXON_ID=186043 /ORGANISM="Entomoneis sp., Strain CCMP2396" /LENGTH=234 /DNA_ID=CAMNT_0043821611 /DNA_START=979 /DNA_END=1680 /DNA_ORIENTATION=+